MGFFLISFALAGDPPSPGHDIPIPPAPATAAREGEGALPPGEPPAAVVPAEGPAEAPAAPPAGAGEDPPTDDDDDADDDADDAAAEDAFVLGPAERREEAATLYVKGLDAWKAGKHSRAWRLATEALALDPELTPARLLVGYALLRMRRTSEGVTTLDGLELEPEASPLPEATRKAARRITRRHEVPYRRDQWWLAVGNITYVERLGELARPLNGYVFAGQAPILGRLALRVDGGSPWGGTGDDLDVRGPRFDLMAVVEQPIDKGLWQVDVGAGPAFWIAEGRYWADGWEPYFGVRAALGVDVRLGATIGLRYEMGASAFPMAAEALPWYAEPLDMRIAVQTWFGK